MVAFLRKGIILLLGFCIVIAAADVKAQVIPIPGLTKQQKDTASAADSIPEVKPNLDTTLPAMMRNIERFTLSLNKDISTLKRGFDTTEISEELPLMERVIELLNKNLEAKIDGMSIRNLYSSQVALKQIEKQVTGYQEKLAEYSGVISAIKSNSEKVAQLPLAISTIEDSTILVGYQSQIAPLMAKKSIADSLQKIASRKIGLLQNRVATAFLTCADLLDDVNLKIRSYQARFYQRDQPYLWHAAPEADEKSFRELLTEGITRNRRVFNFYLSLNTAPFIWVMIFAFAFYFLIKFSIRKLRRDARAGWELPLHYTKRSAAGSTLLLLCTVTPFILQNPPAGIIQILWLIMLFTATALRFPDWPVTFRKYWLGVTLFFIIFGLDYLFIDISYRERMILAGLNVVAVVLGYFMYMEVHKNKGRYHPLMDESIILFIAINALALIMNISGRFTVAKTLSNSSVLSIVLLLALQMIKDIILEFIYLLVESNKHSRFYSYLEFNKIKDGFKNVLGIITLVIWVLAFAWSMNFYDVILEKAIEFLKKPRSLGEITFTFSSILIFIAIIWLSMLIARLVTFIFKDENAAAGKTKGGSWTLLMRLGIYSIGFFLAIGAAGIPLDKLTIVIGALGVGIGFGLQTIVNNLISGIILAFEKPIQVGDIIDIGNRMGEVKEIGIRSSRISTFEGSDIIVPNGDLLSQHLINWTHSNQARRNDILVGVAYGSDLDKTRIAIEKALTGKESMLMNPPPLILVNDFGANAVNFKVLFWARSMGEAGTLKSEVLSDIYNNFAADGIEIPFPQTDLHIRSVDDAAAKYFNRKNDDEDDEATS